MMKIEINEIKNKVLIYKFTDEEEKRDFYNFIRIFNRLRIKAKKDKSLN